MGMAQMTYPPDTITPVTAASGNAVSVTSGKKLGWFWLYCEAVTDPLGRHAGGPSKSHVSIRPCEAMPMLSRVEFFTAYIISSA